MDYLGYEGKVCVVTGAANGIGKATTQLLVDLGAKVYAIDKVNVDVNGIKNFIEADLTNKEAIDMAFEEIPRQIDCFFGIAGVSGINNTYYETFTINYIANKYITENYLKKRMDRGASIVYVSSPSGKHWEKYYSEFNDYSRATTWNDMINILHNAANSNTLGIMAYPLSKRALNYYMATQAIELGRRGIRVNSLIPGSTDTNYINNYQKYYGGMDKLVKEAGIIERLANPQEIAEPLIFLNSDMARFISGYPMVVDYGQDTLVNLDVRKDVTDYKVGLKVFNYNFVQNALAKKYNLVRPEEKQDTNNVIIPTPTQTINTIMESNNMTEHQIIYSEFNNVDSNMDKIVSNEVNEEIEVLEEEIL